jgi:hypothetical protein
MSSYYLESNQDYSHFQTQTFTNCTQLIGISYFKKFSLAKNIARKSGSKDNFGMETLPHNFKINKLVWYETSHLSAKTTNLLLNEKDQPKSWRSMTQMHASSRKSKIINVIHLKKFFVPITDNRETEQNSAFDFNCEQTFSRPMQEQ